MKVKISELRKIVRDTLQEMKLGVANANPPGEAFGARDDEHHTSDLKSLGDLIATVSDVFQPDEEMLANDKYYRDYINRSADNNWDDEGADDEQFDVAGHMGASDKVKTVRRVAERKSLKTLLVPPSKKS